MRYIGSKARVLEFLSQAIHSCVKMNKGTSFTDLFSGTTVVAQHFKRSGCKTISNDYLAFSYVLQMAYLKCNQQPRFSKIKNYSTTLMQLNEVKPIKGFFYQNYCRDRRKANEYQRNYFSIKNSMKIDAILVKLKDWKKQNKIDLIEECVLRASLIDAVTKVSNTSGTYGAFLSIDDPRMHKDILLEPILFIESTEQHECHNEDAFNLIEKISGEVLYLDPPYNQRQYPPYYHILETISLDDQPHIYGKTGRRPYKEKRSPLCIKNEAPKALHDLIKKAKFKHVFLSYNTEGLLSIDEIEKLLTGFGKVRVFFGDYRRYKSNSNGNAKANLREILFHLAKR